MLRELASSTMPASGEIQQTQHASERKANNLSNKAASKSRRRSDQVHAEVMSVEELETRRKGIAAELAQAIYAGFVSYRVWADKDFAEKMYWRLTSENLKIFWDSVCLVAGAPW